MVEARQYARIAKRIRATGEATAHLGCTIGKSAVGVVLIGLLMEAKWQSKYILLWPLSLPLFLEDL